MNIGPKADGTIAPIFQERLKEIGSWLKVNGEAVYSSSVNKKAQKDTTNPEVYYTVKGSNIYAFLLKWPMDNIIRLGVPKPKSPASKVNMLGVEKSLEWKYEKLHGLEIPLPRMHPQQMPCQWIWVLRMTDFY